jgi:hypothetical protein
LNSAGAPDARGFRRSGWAASNRSCSATSSAEAGRPIATGARRIVARFLPRDRSVDEHRQAAHKRFADRHGPGLRDQQVARRHQALDVVDAPEHGEPVPHVGGEGPDAADEAGVAPADDDPLRRESGSPASTTGVENTWPTPWSLD